MNGEGLAVPVELGYGAVAVHWAVVAAITVAMVERLKSVGHVAQHERVGQCTDRQTGARQRPRRRMVHASGGRVERKCRRIKGLEAPPRPCQA